MQKNLIPFYHASCIAAIVLIELWFSGINIWLKVVMAFLLMVGVLTAYEFPNPDGYKEKRKL